MSPLRLRTIRSWIVALLLLCALLLVLVALRAYQVVLQPTPAALEATYDEAVIRFSTENRYVLFQNDCVRASWNVEGIKGVSINDDATIGSDSRQVCGETPYLTVIFADDTQQDYVLPREVVVETPLFYALVAATIALLIAGGWVFGVWQWGYRLFLRTSHFSGRAWDRLTGWLPVPPPEAPGERWLHLWLLCGLILFGVGWRAAYLNMVINTDEAWTFSDFASQPLTIGLANYWTTNNHLLNTLLVHISYRVFGDEAIWLRLPAFFAGILLIPAVYQVGRVFYNRSAGLIAAALAAASSILTEYSTQARGYTLMFLIFLLLLIVAKRISRQNRSRDWIVFSGLTVLGFYTIPLMIYPFAMIVAWLGLTLLATHDRARRFRLIQRFAAALIAAGVLTALLYAPVVLFMRSGVETRSDFGHLEIVSVERVARDLPFWVSEMLRAEWYRDLPRYVVGLLVPGFIGAILLHRRLSTDRFSLPLVALGAALLLLFSYRVVFVPRTWLFALPLFFISAAAAYSYIISLLTARRQWLRVAVSGGGALALALFIGSRDQDIHPIKLAFDAEEITARLAQQLQPGDTILKYLDGYGLIRYHAPHYGIDPDVIYFQYGAIPAPDRIFMIVDPYENQPKVERELLETGVERDECTEPELQQQVGSHYIFILHCQRAAG